LSQPHPTADETNNAELPTVEAVLPVKKGRPTVAWAVIIILLGVIIGLPHLYQTESASEVRERASLVIVQMQARLLVGAAELEKKSGQDYYKQAASLNHGPLEQRLCFVILAGELAGPGEASKQLRILDEKLTRNNVQPTKTQLSLSDVLRRLYEDYSRGCFDAPSLSEKDRGVLRMELGWFGDLALALAGTADLAARKKVIDSAQRTFFVLAGGIMGLGVLALAGFAGIILFLKLLFTGRLRRGIHCGLLHGGVYAETFAVWLVAFLGLRFVLGWLPLDMGWLGLSAAVSLFSLVALAWPVLRGIPWKQVRQEIGLTGGRKPLLEPVIGFGTYVMALSLAAVGVAITVVLIFLTNSFKTGVQNGDDLGPSGFPVHPIVQFAAESDWWGRIQLLFLLSVVAPFVEEIIFRGVLYRHLREASARFGLAGSILVSGGVASFIFAAIHPQGLLFVPVLMGLAFAFVLAREWRGTLIPSMVAHGITNGVTGMLLMLGLGG
jgi:membrane protease YdiL (CAAX protease family)